MSSCLNRLALAALAAPAAVVALLAVSPAPTSAALVANSKHNLSASGPGTIKATTESEICVFCHVPHNSTPGVAPLWNRRLSSAVYTPYTSSTKKAAVGQPNGTSMLCLGCHDGTVALGEVRNRTPNITMAAGVTTLPAGNSNLGTDLRDDHPISFVYNAALRTLNPELADPAPLLLLTSQVRLDASSQVQCTSCHNAHDNANGKFLVVNNAASALCVTCHTKNYWTGSDHRNSTKTWNGTGTNPWQHTSGTTVASNACENCHRPHTAGGGARILNYAVEETNCLVCHSGTVATKNIATELAKARRHNVAGYTGIHDPAEAATVTTSHVECVDCHNPHAAYASSPPSGSTPGGTTTPALAGSQIGVRGINISGTAVNPATAEYEICFRCHADGGAANIPASAFPRKIVQNNKRLEFQPANASHHAVAGAGASSSVPSLIAPWTTSSRLRCTDCHNNNAGPYSSGTPAAPTGTGPNGPHGSTNPFLLERTYLTTDNSGGVSYSAANYALCYKCHSETSILSDVSFGKHSRHLSGGWGSAATVCSTCHDPHGISSTQGMSAANGNTTNKRLVNFRTDIVTANSSGKLYWESTGTNSGNCYLSCHGRDHGPKSY